MTKVFDMELALAQAGGSLDLARDLFHMLRAELPGFLKGVRSAHIGGDLAALRHTTHKINGAATYCGVPLLKTAADELETRIKLGQTDDLDQRVDRLIAAIEQVLALSPPEFV